MPSSISNFERPIPVLPWARLVTTAALLTVAAATAWELKVRSWGYAPAIVDCPDLWAERRRAVKPDSVVIIGDSRPHFDLDLDQLELGLGKRPIQLALDGSCGYPVFADLVDDENFHGTIIASLVPLMWLAPAGPPMKTSEKAVARYHHQTYAQRSGQWLGMLLEERIAFLKEQDLTLAELLNKVPLPPRKGTGGPPLPPYFQTIDRERRATMAEACAVPGPLQERVKNGWPALFTPPPPPSYIPPEVFGKIVGGLIEKRFKDTAEGAAKFRARGGKIVFVRFPVAGGLKQIEDAATPRQGPWTRILSETGAPGIYFEDYPELSRFTLPEWSHLSGPDSIEFTKSLVPHLKAALATP